MIERQQAIKLMDSGGCVFYRRGNLCVAGGTIIEIFVRDGCDYARVKNAQQYLGNRSLKLEELFLGEGEVGERPAESEFKLGSTETIDINVRLLDLTLVEMIAKLLQSKSEDKKKIGSVGWREYAEEMALISEFVCRYYLTQITSEPYDNKSKA